ncbi:MAG: DNA internalization-related competence protein ComEC/Rec2 [Christensenellales bacterium]|nr:DNA internalization-related competence protein ComEC/Rec2 [Christensenellales bacterium]
MKRVQTPVILPVRRRLMAVAVSYLLGIFAAVWAAPSPLMLHISCVLLLAWGALRLIRRKHAFWIVLVFMLLLGSLRAGGALRLRDAPTAPGVMLRGRIVRILKPYRVMLADVTADGTPTARPVVVTLMQEEDEPRRTEPQVGQEIQGRGRLFVPEEPRNIGGVSRRIQAICSGYELSGYVLPGWTAEGKAAFSLWEGFRRLRLDLVQRTEGLFGEQAALFCGVMLGERAGLSDELAASMRLTGTAHILTVSGLHLSMAAGLFSRLLRRLPLRRRTRFAVLSAFLLGFTGLTGAAPGTIRACIMAMMREYAVVRGRRYEPLTALACAALLMMLAVPLWALHASFQFSFFVVLGIQLFSRGMESRVSRRIPARLHRLAGAALLCLSAQAAALPMQLWLYGYVPLLALPMNLICGLFTPVMLLGGWFALLLSPILPQEDGVCARLLAMAATGFERLSLWAAGLPAAIVRLPSPYGWGVLLFGAAMLLLSSRIRFGRWRRQALALVLGLLLGGYALRFDPRPRYVQLDVGQGDAALWRCGRRAVLVDVGPADSYEMLRYLRHEGLCVEQVFLSHLDEDHAGALDTLLTSEVQISSVATAVGAQQDVRSGAVQAALAHMEERGMALGTLQRGARMAAAGASIEVLAPQGMGEEGNDGSLLLHMELEDVTFLLTGDLTQAGEPADVPRCDVLKVAHHGSRYATSDAFIAQAAPELALISVGAGNRYGHPGERVLTALDAAGAQVLRTDETGGVTLWLEDGACRVDTFLGERTEE